MNMVMHLGQQSKSWAVCQEMPLDVTLCENNKDDIIIPAIKQLLWLHALYKEK